MASSNEGESSGQQTTSPHSAADNKTGEKITSPTEQAEDHGYYFYPKRNGPAREEKSNFLKRAFSHEDINHFKCVSNVKSCFQSHPMVRLMVGALQSHGCPVDIDRHISCESCREKVSGGFDPKTMQAVVCQNNVTRKEVCCNVLAHELLHAFDFCRAKVDFNNVRHLACTEIRAASLNHCSLAAAMASGEASIFGIKERHQLCVKNKALQSVRLVRDITEFDAMVVIDEVFDKCYNDTEPYGRRCFKDFNKAKRALDDARNYYDFD